MTVGATDDAFVDFRLKSPETGTAIGKLADSVVSVHLAGNMVEF